jgi:hypothetical protein
MQMENESVGAQDNDDVQGSTMQETLAQIDPGQMLESVTTFARENPHTAIAVAAGIGFVLGGGLTPRLLGTIGLFAARQYFRETMREQLQGSLGEQLGIDA